MSLDVEKIRQDFPAINGPGKAPIYLDNACVTLRPQQVIEAMNQYYAEHPSCHRRSVHKFGKRTTEGYEQAKKTLQKFINANDHSEIIFTKNATEAINIVAHQFPFKPEDVILISDLEHNSNFLPWQVTAKQQKLTLKMFSLGADLTFDMDKFKAQLKSDVKLVSVVHTSHVTGYTLPLKEIIELAHDHGAFVMVDAAQSAAHIPLDVQELDVDFLAFSFHKMLGPSGMGCLYAKKKHLEAMNPFLMGGETVDDVSHNSYVLAPIPERFEAGLQNYAGALGVSAAVTYLENIGMEQVHQHIQSLNEYISNELGQMAKVHLIGPASAEHRSGIVNFYVDDMDSGELSIILDQTHNIMTRSGVHCCHAGYKRYRLPESLRASLYVYNTMDEAKVFVDTIQKIVQFF